MPSPDPGLPSLCGPDGEIPPAVLQQAISTLHEAAATHGLHRRRLVLLLGNSPLFAAALFSVFARRGSTVLLNPALTASEIEKALAVTGAAHILAPAEYRADQELANLHPQQLQEISLPSLGALKLWRVGESDVTPPDSEFVVQFTSGVSGIPLAVSRTYAQADNEVSNLVARIALSSGDIVLCAAPLFHSYGLFAGLMVSRQAGAKFIVLPSFTPADVADALARYRPTVFLGVPFMYEILQRSAGAFDFSSLRLLLSAGAPLLAETAQAFTTRFGKTISQLYGTTEAGVIAVNFGDGDSGSVTSVGLPLQDRRIRIVDANGGDVPAGTEGEVVLSSPATATSYLGRPEQSAEKFRDGWYHTGDIGRRDAAGHLALTGRKSSFINVGGLKVDPAEVEQAIMASGEALECAVVGVLRPQFGEIIAAHVVLKPDGALDRLRAHCRAHLASFKMPREFHSVNALPRSATGKVLRKYLIE